MKLRTRLALTIILAGIPILAGFWMLQLFFQKQLSEEVLAQFVMAHMQSVGRQQCEADPQNWNFNEHGGPDGGPFPPDFTQNSSTMPASGAGRPVLPPDGIRPPGQEINRHDDGFHPRGHGPKFGLYAYDTQFKSLNPEAPELSVALVRKIQKNGSRAERVVKDDFFDKNKLRNRPFSPDFGDRKPPGDHKVLEVLLKMPWDDGPCAYILARRPQPPTPGMSSDSLPPIQMWLFPVLFVLAIVLISVGPMVRRTRQLTHEVREFARTSYGRQISIGGKDEIGQLAQAFKDAGDEIRSHIARQEQREQTLRNFLDNTTHDVMIPLTVLQGHLSAMQERLNKTEKIDNELLTSAMSESQYITSLIHNLSVAAKIEEGAPALEWEPVNLNRLVERVIGRHRPVARQKNVSIDHTVPENPVWCDGDMTFIEQSINNVVYNAIRHNRSGGHVAVLLECSGDSDFSLRVIDDGPGIAEDDLVKLLDKCRRPDAARSREHGRHGFGLRIACQLAEMHRWSFNIKRSEYGGLQVDFVGPRADSSREQET